MNREYVIKLANEAVPLNSNGTNQHSKKAGDNNCNTLKRQGNDPEYLTARIARDRPDILELMKQGEFRSVRAAAIEAGVIKTSTPPWTADDTTAILSNFDQLLRLEKQYGCIYVDPPWSYDNQRTRAAANNHYGTMSTEDIAQLPVGEIAAKKSHLHLWTTKDFLFDALEIMKVWGFEYKGALVWVKPQMGMGNYWRVSHEYLLLGVRGKLSFSDRSQKSWLNADRTKHSRKPDVVRAMLEKVSPGPYLELFARQTCPRWTALGNQIEKTLFDAA